MLNNVWVPSFIHIWLYTLTYSLRGLVFEPLVQFACDVDVSHPSWIHHQNFRPIISCVPSFVRCKSTSQTLSYRTARWREIHKPYLLKALALSLIRKCDLLHSIAFWCYCCYYYYYCVIHSGFSRDPRHLSEDRCTSLWFFLCPAVSLASNKLWLNCQTPNYGTF